MTKSELILPYVFWWNEKMYEVDGDTFAKLSKKFPQIREQYPNQYIMEDNYKRETFEAFLNACQLKPFDVNKNNAFELLDLATEWKVPSLLSFVQKYIEDNKLEPKVKEDFLGILLEHVATDTDNYTDWANVAADINDALRDERFADVPPEVIFQILAIADRKRSVNKLALIDFVMGLYRTNPVKAVPLMLRLDFSQMNRDQLEEIFKEKLTHEQNVSFFIASSLSAIDNKVEIEIAKAEKCRNIELTVLKNNLKREREAKLAEISRKYQEELEQRRQDIERQQKMIDALEAAVLQHRDRVAAEERKVRARRTPIADDALERINASISEEVERLSQDCEKNLLAFQSRMDRMQLEAPRTARQYFSDVAERSASETSKAKTTLKGLEDLIWKASDDVDAAKKEAESVRAALGAKVLRDKLRFDQFLRRTTNRFKVFERCTELGVTPANAKAAEEELRQIEARIDKLCPLRQAGVMSPPGSPAK